MGEKSGRAPRGAGEKRRRRDARRRCGNQVYGGAAASAPDAAGTRPAGLLVRLRRRSERASLASVFVGYLAAYLVAATALTLAVVWALGSAYDYAWDRQMPVHVYNGPYLFDAGRGDLVPAASIEVGDYSGDVSLYLGIDAGASSVRAADVADADGASEAYATLDMIAQDPALTLSDWGGNFPGSYDPGDYDRLMAQGGEDIDPADLPAYDARQRAVRTQVNGSAIGLSLDSATPSSNVAYYVSQDMDSTPPVFALRLLGGVAPFAIYGVMAWVVFRRFYRRRLAEPLAVLARATDKVAAQDLDFTVPPVPGRELGQLAAAFERMRASLADAQRRMWRTAEERKRLNAAFAHDLRTPLTVLKGTVEMAQLRLDAGAVGAESAAEGSGADELRSEGEKDTPGPPRTDEGSRGAAPERVPDLLPDEKDAPACEADGSAVAQGEQDKPAAPAAAGEDARVAEARRTLETLGAQVVRLQRYTEVMSSASKLEDRAVKREPVPLAAFARDLAEEAAALVAASPRRLAFSCTAAADGADAQAACGAAQADPGAQAGFAGGTGAAAEPFELLGQRVVEIDGALVAEAVGNLLNNARGHAETRVSLALAYCDGVLSCTVADDGPGFTAEALRRGCEPFYSEAKSAEHFGMGLNIAQVLAGLHGGSVELGNADPPDHGARVTVRFRCGEPSAGAAAGA